MKITVLNKSEAKKYQPEKTAVIIRMEDVFPMKKVEGIYLKEKRFYFRDVSCDSEWAITEEDAVELANFIKTCQGVEEIVVHCVFAQGRSPAVAKIISEYFKVPFINKYPDLNQCVYSKIKKYLF